MDSLSIATVNPRDPKHSRPLVVAAEPEMGVLIETIMARKQSYVGTLGRAVTVSDSLENDDGRRAEWIPWQSLHLIMPNLPADTIIVCVDDLGLVRMLAQVFSSPWLRDRLCPEQFGDFEFSLSEEIRDVDYRPDAPRITTTEHRVLHAGFRSKVKGKRGHWYRIVSAAKYLAASSLRSHKWNLWDLLEFGQIAADFCAEMGIPLMASAGSTAARLLRLRKYYPEARRRVPRATNENARPALRGHPYKLYVEPMRPVTAIEFDQSSAHPNAAATIPLPHANGLYAGFNFTQTKRDILDKPSMLWRGSRRFDREISRPGLFLLRLYGRNPENAFCPPEWQIRGPFDDFVTSNEIEWLGELGIGIDGIIARWTSPIADEGIKAYAEDALAFSNARSGFDRAVVKATFLAGLGVLGAKPHAIKVLRGHEITGGETVTIRTKQGPLACHRKEMSRSYQLSIANLIQRAMIEREAAKRSWQFLSRLCEQGWSPVCLYADSVFAMPPDGQQTLIDTPTPWRQKAIHTNLQFRTATHFVSDQAVKMPGISSERERARGLMGARLTAAGSGTMSGTVNAH